MRHYIVHQSKLWVHIKGMDVLYILIPTIELQVPDHPGIYLLDQGILMLLIKVEIYMGYPLYSLPPLSHWFCWIPLGCLSWIWGT